VGDWRARVRLRVDVRAARGARLPDVWASGHRSARDGVEQDMAETTTDAIRPAKGLTVPLQSGMQAVTEKDDKQLQMRIESTAPCR